MAKDIMTSGIEMSDVIKATGFPVPEDMEGKTFAECVSGGGGGGITVEALSATENKVYTAPEGKAYSPVTVNVPSGEDTTGFSVQCISLSDDYITCVEFPRSTKVTAVTFNSPIIAGGVQKGYAVFGTPPDEGIEVTVVYDDDTYSYTYADRDYQSHELVKENP